MRNRYNQHNSKLRINAHTNKHLQNAVNKYGIVNFVFSILESNISVINLDTREAYWMNYYGFDNLYNIRKDPRSNVGLKHSSSVKEAQSIRAATWWKHNAGKASHFIKDHWKDPIIRQRYIDSHTKYKNFELLDPLNNIVVFSSVEHAAHVIGSTPRQIYKLLNGEIKYHRKWLLP